MGRAKRAAMGASCQPTAADRLPSQFFPSRQAFVPGHPLMGIGPRRTSSTKEDVMASLLLLTSTTAASAEILPALGLLGHSVKVGAPEPSGLLDAAPADAVLVDARRELPAAKSLCRLLITTGISVPVPPRDRWSSRDRSPAAPGDGSTGPRRWRRSAARDHLRTGHHR